MRTTIKEWGNTTCVRIPAAVLQATGLDVDDLVEVREEAGRIVIEPLRRKEYDLGELLKGVSRRNLHREVDFGGPPRKS
jgi:antitoxin MazE